ncbi:serine hydrolase [Fulvivirgaceae bacterium BMA12]|uniref:Serine hydrolase n=1 Tax=Agaribacillus aureus TaxID=3051825 RepID=A0ABT8LHH6_9BACT|nr:serine hydrolase [Fulvivirgaceae bacterium BMA12]
MKLIRRILLTLFIFILLVSLIAGVFFRREARRLYYVITLFDQDKISQNFRGIVDIFPTSVVKKPDRPNRFPYATSRIQLPAYFSHEDSTINTQNFLDYTLTDGLLIIHHDTIVFEQYSNGFSETDHHISWSMSKSFISALFGIAISEGKIKSIEQTVTEYLPELKGTGYDGVRIKDVLQMSTGVGFNEDYGDFNSDINRMGRYLALGMSMDDFAASLKRERTPGTYNHYVSVNTHVLGMILKRVTGQSIAQYMEERLWQKIGAESDGYWIVDDTGMEFVLGGLNLIMRDYAKIGQLYLDSGRWQGQQIVPESWVLASITPDAPHLIPGSPNSNRPSGYGYQWWIPEGGDDEFLAQGIYNQFIYVDPDKALVLVKLSSNYRFKKEKISSRNITLSFFRTIAEGLN